MSLELEALGFRSTFLWLLSAALGLAILQPGCQRQSNRNRAEASTAQHAAPPKTSSDAVPVAPAPPTVDRIDYSWSRSFHPVMPKTPLKPAKERRLIESGPEIEAAEKSIGLQLKLLYPLDRKCCIAVEQRSSVLLEWELADGHRATVDMAGNFYLAAPIPTDDGSDEVINGWHWFILERQPAGNFVLVDHRPFSYFGWICIADVNDDSNLDIVLEDLASDPGGSIEAYTVEPNGKLRDMAFAPSDLSELSVPGGACLINLDGDPALEMVICDWWQTFNRGYQYVKVADFDNKSGTYIDRGDTFPEITGEQTGFYATYEAACADLLAERKATGKSIDELLPEGQPLLTWKGKPYDICLEASTEVLEAINEDQQSQVSR